MGLLHWLIQQEKDVKLMGSKPAQLVILSELP